MLNPRWQDVLRKIVSKRVVSPPLFCLFVLAAWWAPRLLAPPRASSTTRTSGRVLGPLLEALKHQQPAAATQLNVGQRPSLPPSLPHNATQGKARGVCLAQHGSNNLGLHLGPTPHLSPPRPQRHTDRSLAGLTRRSLVSAYAMADDRTNLSLAGWANVDVDRRSLLQRRRRRGKTDSEDRRRRRTKLSWIFTAAISLLLTLLLPNGASSNTSDVGPETIVRRYPSGAVVACSATLTISCDAAEWAYETSLDGGPWTLGPRFRASRGANGGTRVLGLAQSNVVVPHAVTGLSAGSHTISVRTLDSKGVHDSTPFTTRWEVVAPTAKVAFGPTNANAPRINQPYSWP